MLDAESLIAILADGKYHSAVELGKTFATSKQSLLEMIQHLQSYGITIICMPEQGYALSDTLTLLNTTDIYQQLPAATAAQISALDLHMVTSSTNQLLLEKSYVHRHIVLAEYQTQGRGRRGRLWHSPFASGINLSIGWHIDTLPCLPAALSLIIGVAVMRALSKLGISGLCLKWPNDIQYKSKKIGGILVEIKGPSAGPYMLVIGIGINHHIPHTYTHNWSDLAAASSQLPTRAALAAMLIAEIFYILQSAAKLDTQQIFAEWQTYDGLQGNLVQLTIRQQVIQGTVLGIDELGYLQVNIGQQVQSFAEGEIELKVMH